VCFHCIASLHGSRYLHGMHVKQVSVGGIYTLHSLGLVPNLFYHMCQPVTPSSSSFTDASGFTIMFPQPGKLKFENSGRFLGITASGAIKMVTVSLIAVAYYCKEHLNWISAKSCTYKTHFVIGIFDK